MNRTDRPENDDSRKDQAMTATASIPDNLPRLIHGASETPEDGACAMQAVAWLWSAGQEWTDAPACTHPVFRRLAIRINDNADDTTRQQLWPLLPRLIGTRDPDPAARNRISVTLAAWSAEQALPLITNPEQHKTAASRIARARAWLSNDAAAAAAAAAGDAAAAAADAGAAAAYAAADDAAAAACAAAAAGDAAAYAAACDAADEIEFLARLLDEYDRITGRTETPPIPDTIWAQFRATIGTNRKTA
jgi:hypothetical protein